MRTFLPSYPCKASQPNAPGPQARLHVGSCNLPKPFSHHSSIESLIKVPEPQILALFKPLDYVKVLAEIHEELQSCPQQQTSNLYLLQSSVFRGLGEVKLVQRSLRSAWKKSTSVLEKLIYGAWLKYGILREGLTLDLLASCWTCKQQFGFSDIVSELAVDVDLHYSMMANANSTRSKTFRNVVFRIGGDTITCDREKIAALSAPFDAMLNGSFSEAFHDDIDLSQNDISPDGMRAIHEFSITRRLSGICRNLLSEILIFADRFCCDQLKYDCEMKLTAFITSMNSAVELFEVAVEGNSTILTVLCLQVFLHELPQCLNDDQVVDLLSSGDGHKRLPVVGQESFSLYCLLSEVAMDLDPKSEKTADFLERLVDSAESNWERQLAFHQLGCVRLLRKEYDEAKKNFGAALKEGHAYSLLGLTRIDSIMGDTCSSYDKLTSMISSVNPVGWMYQERSLYCGGDKKWADLEKATELDPTLTFPYMYRAASLMREADVVAAISEINRMLGFKLALELLELRLCFYLVIEDYKKALCDVQAILTVSPDYRMFEGRVAATQLCTLVREHVENWTTADFWMKLHDRWSSVDDVGSLSVIYQMLESDVRKGVLYFRQSLLLRRLNCPEAALRSLRLACEHASSDHERLVYEGWILHDTGHCVEGLWKANESIDIKRSFEAFFLKAHALAHANSDPPGTSIAVSLLEDALRCPSDRLRKGQALNDLGSLYVKCRQYDLAANCYINAIQMQHTQSHQGLAQLHFLNNDKDAAYAEMTKLIRRARMASAYEKRSEYGELERVEADLEMATRLDPLLDYPYRYRAAVLMDMHKEKEAIEELSRAIAFKVDAQLLQLRASICDNVHDAVGAIRDCRAALLLERKHKGMVKLHQLLDD